MTRSQPDLTLLQGNSKLLRPPPDLTEEERQTFVSIVASVGAKHFIPSDLPLLVSYCVAVCQERVAHAHLRVEGYVIAGRPSPWVTCQEKAHRQSATLATKLRLAPSCRTRTKVRPEVRSAYEVMALEEGNDDD
jgi:phage terminase small subunit